MYGYKLSNSLDGKENIVVKAFSGATVKCMSHYVQPTMEKKPEKIILHCGTNNLKSNSTPYEIAKEIVALAKDVATEENTVIISSIIPRNDHLNSKASEVNNILSSLCLSHDIEFISHSNIDIKSHLNSRGIHLNKSGVYVIVNNFLNFLKVT